MSLQRQRRRPGEQDERLDAEAGGIVQPDLPQALGNQAFAALVQEGRVGRAGPGGRIVARAPAAAEMEDAADAAERTRAVEQSRGPTSQVAKLSVVSDIAGAEKLRGLIINRRWFIEKALKEQDEGIADGNVDDAKRQKNEDAIVLLDRYLEDSTEQRGALGSFKTQVANLELDHERLIAQMVSYAGTRQGKGTNDVPDPEAVGRAQIKSTGVKAGEFRRATTSTRGGAVAAHQEAAREGLAKMNTLSQDVASTHRKWHAAERNAYAKAARLESLLSARSAKGVRGNIDALKEDAEKAKEQIAYIGEIVNGVIGIGKAAVDKDPLEALAGVVELGFKIAEHEAAKKFDREIADLEIEVKTIGAETDRKELAAVVAELSVAKTTLLDQAQAYINANLNLERAQDDYRSSMSEMGAAADKVGGRGGRFEVLAQLLSEADAYLAQADATIAIGAQEQEAAKKVAGSAAPIEYKYGKDWTSWWNMGPPRFNKNRPQWYAIEEPLLIRRLADDRVDPTVDEAMEQLQAIRDNVADHAATLRTAFTSRTGE